MRYVVLILIIGLLSVSFVIKNNYKDEYKKSEGKIVLEKQKLKLEKVSDNESRARGLSGRETLEEDSGMLFEFEKSDIHGIWMKDMNFAIDIIWLNKDGVVNTIIKDAKPESYPHVFYPNESSMYVIEVVSGYTDRNDIKVGDKLI